MGWNEQDAGVKAAFKALRKQGVAARRAAACCGGCSASLMHEQVERRGLRGAVHTHRQGEARWKRPYGAPPSLYISFGACEGGDSVSIGKELFAALKAAGVECEWDGTVDSCVEVRGCW